MAHVSERHATRTIPLHWPTCEWTLTLNFPRLCYLSAIISFQTEMIFMYSNLTPKLYVDVQDCACQITSKIGLYTNISHDYPPISIPFSKEKYPILLKLGAFNHNLLQIHPIYVIWAHSSLMEKVAAPEFFFLWGGIMRFSGGPKS